MIDFVGSGEALAATPGATLAAVRKANGLSVSDVAAQMRISARQVEAIEADRYKDLPGAVFVRGFVRNYARLLKLDPVPLLHALEAQLGDDMPLRSHQIAGTMPGDSRRGHVRAWLVALALLTLIVVAAGAYELWRTWSERKLAPVSRPPAQAPAPPKETIAQPGAALSLPAALNPATGAGDLALPATPRDDHTTTRHDALERASSASEPTPPKRDAAGGRVELKFLRDSWIEIRSKDGNLIHSGTGTGGSARTWDLTGPAEVSIGNVAGVQITYNGRPVDLSAYAARNIARLTLE